MRTKKEHMQNRGLYIENKRYDQTMTEAECTAKEGKYKDGNCIYWVETEKEMWFDYDESRKRSIGPFLSPLASDSILVLTDTQNDYKIGERLRIDDDEYKIRQIIKMPLRQKGNKRSMVRQWKYRIEAT